MEDINLSKNYVKIFTEAEKKGQVEHMSLAFRELCAEMGISDPQSDESQAAAGKLAAELRNAKDKGIGGKKL